MKKKKFKKLLTETVHTYYQSITVWSVEVEHKDTGVEINLLACNNSGCGVVELNLIAGRLNYVSLCEAFMLFCKEMEKTSEKR